MRKFSKVLVANRGEIACRIMRTCKKLALKTVAVYSSADRNSLHRKMADESICIGDAESIKSYLNIEAILDAAQTCKAQAIHPGYGFLSENAIFAESCEKKSIAFIGPSAESIRLVGDKLSAKNLAKQCKVPLVPSVQVDSAALKQNKISELRKDLEKIGLPLIIKAASGGGGRGMRKLLNFEHLEELLISAQREAISFFANGQLFIEKLIQNARHIEVQILGDTHGYVTHVSERDCSLQRKHQKVIEEAPAFNLDQDLRQALHKAAVSICSKAKYVGAGTVEFLVDRHNFYFLEVNSRLQVEHPASEMISGLDLVELQIKIAQGEKLKEFLKSPNIKGHAIEVRLCAEMPEQGFAPQSGKLDAFEFETCYQHNPDGTTLRIDSGFRSNDFISHYYDSLLAKVIVHAEDREGARRLLLKELGQRKITGVATNLNFLLKLLNEQDFISANHSINSIDNLLANQTFAALEYFQAACLFALSQLSPNAENYAAWDLNYFWSLGSVRSTVLRLEINAQPLELLWSNANVFEAKLDSNNFKSKVSELIWDGLNLSCLLNGARVSCSVLKVGAGNWIRTTSGIFFIKEVRAALKAGSDQKSEHNPELISNLPGKIVDVLVKNGDTLQAGDIVLLIESMKMEHALTAHANCKIMEITVKKGDIVESGQILTKVSYT